MIRAGDEHTIWSGLHARQAFVFGALASFAYVLFLAAPALVVAAFPALSPRATIDLYAIAFAADVAVGLLLASLSVWYATRAARGELFAIPLVTPIVDRWFGTRRP